MMSWLRRFFYSDDPPTQLVRGLLEPEAELWRQRLEHAGISAYTKSMDAVSRYGMQATSTDMAIFVNRSDLARAREVLDLEEA